MSAALPEPPVPSPVGVCLHGAAHLRQRGGATVALDRVQAAVIAWLAVHGPTPRSRLAGLLWPEASEERARGNLRQRLSKLRLAAGEVVGDERGLLALASGTTIDSPSPGAHWLDAFSYDDCADFSAWLETEREAQRAVRRQALLAAVRAAALRGALDRALEQADELLAVDRESEEAYRTLMEVFYLRGDLAAAIAVWDRCREMLRNLYGVLPSAATQRLGKTLLDSAGSVSMPAPAVAIPVTVLRPPRLVGRAGVAATLAAAWRIGDAVCVSGEAGVGKSRMLAEFATLVGPCAFAAARPGDAVLPYASLSRLVLVAVDRFSPQLSGDAVAGVTRLLPQLAARLGSAQPEPLRTTHERTEALRWLAAMLDACVARGCAAFVFDDLQFADMASVEALQALVERDAGMDTVMPSRLALGSRSEEETPHGAALLASLASARRLQRVVLEPLGEGEVLELMQSLDLPDFDAALQAPRLRRGVGGNPAFLLESVKLIAALGQLGSVDQALPVPPGIEAVVERRLSLLSPVARHIAELAAVAGESYSVGLAAQALGRPVAELGESLRELEWRQILYGREFVHDVVAAAVRRTVPAAVSELLHRFVAEQLQGLKGEPAVIAGHWRACGEWRRAADSFRAAADKAKRAVRPAELAQLLDTAAECYARCGAQAERFATLCDRLLVIAAPDYTRMRMTMVQQLEAVAVGEEQQLHALVAKVSWYTDHVLTETLALGEQGLRRASPLGLDRLAFEFAQAVAWQLACNGESSRAIDVLAARQAWVLAQDDPPLRSRFYLARSGIHAFSERLADAIADSESALAILRAADDQIAMLVNLANVGLFRAWRGELVAAREVLEQARGLRDRLHGRGSALLIDLHYGAVLRDLGDYAQALAVLEPALAEYKAQLAGDAELRTDVVVGENHLAQLWLLLGDPRRAEACMVSDAAATGTRFRARRAALMLRASRARGPVDEGRLAATRQLAGELPPSFNRTMTELELMRVADPAAAEAALAALCKEAVLRERPGLRMHALALRVEALRRLGQGDLALACAEEILELDERFMPFDIDPVSVWSAAHAALRDAGQAARARAVAEKAERWLHATATNGVPPTALDSFARQHAAACRAMGIRVLPTQ